MTHDIMWLVIGLFVIIGCADEKSPPKSPVFQKPADSQMNSPEQAVRPRASVPPMQAAPQPIASQPGTSGQPTTTPSPAQVPSTAPQPAGSSSVPTQSATTSAWADELSQLAAYPGGRGVVVNRHGQEFLIIHTQEGDVDFIGLTELPPMACRNDKRRQRPSNWWVFEGNNPVGLQLIRNSADFWRYDVKRSCVASSIAFRVTDRE